MEKVLSKDEQHGSYFGQSTERMKQFREELLSTVPTICVQRAIYTTQAYKEHRDKPMTLKRAYSLKNILENMDIYIEPLSLLAGNQASANRAAPIFPEYAMDWVIAELDEYDKRNGDMFKITEENKQKLREIAPFWDKITLKDKGLGAMPSHSRLLYDIGVIKAEGNITSGDGHVAVNYGEVLSHGLEWYRERAQTLLNGLDLTDYTNLKKSYFYRAAIMTLDAVMDFSDRYAKLAMELAKTEEDPQRKKELIAICEACSKVPRKPAETFREAIQAVWLTHLVLQIESNGHSMSYGRLDQFAYPYYKKDLESGLITEEEACELLENLWVKTLSINKVRSWTHTRFSAGSPLYQNVTVGGQTTDGKDAVNPLSYLILKSVARQRLPQPNLTVRYHKGLSDDFMKECIEVIRLGFGMPAFNSDEIIIPSFIEKGVAKEDAYNYSAVGCVEVAVPGKWGYRCTGMSFLNFPRALMIALNDGVDVESGKRAAKGVGHFLQAENFDQVMEAWDTTIRELTRQCIIMDNCADTILEQEVADIFCSCLVDDCLGRGLHLKEGGAVYDFISDLQVGIANLGDSLAAIKKCVFEDKLLTKQELWDALLNDFAGEEGKRVQKILIEQAPKYGNDDDYVDQLLVQAYDSNIDEMSKYHNTRYGRGPIGGKYYAGTSSISANVPQGASTSATPDGRHRHEPLAEGCAPSHGMDVHGPTAVFKSVSKLRTDQITGGVLLNQKVTPQMLEKEGNREKLAMLTRTFFDELKGFHVQYNVVSRETLREAQVLPEKHRDLVVRVAGYSAFFNALSEQTQDDIIERTEQTL